MKIIIAPDKFKGSLTGLEFCNIVEQEFLKAKSITEIIKLPLADGGDGTIEIANYYLEGEFIEVTVNDPFFKPIKAKYLFSKKSNTAFIEMAEASGLKLLQKNELDCKRATTFGTGELIKDALEKGAKSIILGIGGSATNDCGIGMASALGYKFLDCYGNQVKPIGENLEKIVSIDISEANLLLRNVSFKIACDVKNPLYGKNGAAYVYAKQKGASLEEVKILDNGLNKISKLIEATFNIDPQKVRGAGAAGGMGIASKVFLKGELISGIELIKDLAEFDKNIKNIDWIITGEGKLDNQTLSGKVIQGVIKSAKKSQVKVAVFCGSLEMSNEDLQSIGINYADDVISKTNSLDNAMKNAEKYLKEITLNFINQVN